MWIDLVIVPRVVVVILNLVVVAVIADVVEAGLYQYSGSKSNSNSNSAITSASGKSGVKSS